MCKNTQNVSKTNTNRLGPNHVGLHFFWYTPRKGLMYKTSTS